MMLVNIWESERAPPYMDASERQLRYRITAFRKRRIVEGRAYDPARIPAESDYCVFCDEKNVPFKEMGLVGDYQWGCRQCRDKMHDHTARDATRFAIKQELADLLNSVSTGSNLHQHLKDLKTIRDLIVERANENKEKSNSNNRKRPGAEDNAFSVIYSTPIVNTFDDSHFTLEELKELEIYEMNLYQQTRSQHQTIFFEKNLETLITKSVRNRQSAFVRHRGTCERLHSEHGMQMWVAQRGRCNQCREPLGWNWAAVGQASLAQLDRIDVTKLSYVNNCVWLCQACNAHKGFAIDTLAYDKHFLGVLNYTKANLESEDRIISVLEEAKTLHRSRQVLNR